MKHFRGNIIIFNIKLSLQNSIKTKWFNILYFLILYSLFRFLVEFTRETDPQLGFIIFNFTMGQVITYLRS